ncbi:hypothetical protein ACC677_38395, partial [Rhizobium ruizarguesonis]
LEDRDLAAFDETLRRILLINGSIGGGGTISDSGTIGIQPAGGFPTDISIKIDKAVYVDGNLVVSTVNGKVGLRGPITN